MAKKVYGVSGMMEWHAVIPIGKSAMCVKFTGGTLSGYGVTPAKFTTSDKVTQKMIENSVYFKNGKIKLLRVYETEQDRPVMSNIVESAPLSTPLPLPTEEKEIVEVASLEDAKEFLKEKYGIAWNKLKTKSAILEIAENMNIEFVIK